MDGFILFVLVVLGVVVIMPIVALVKASSASREAGEAKERLRALELRNKALEERVQGLIRDSVPAVSEAAAVPEVQRQEEQVKAPAPVVEPDAVPILKVEEESDPSETGPSQERPPSHPWEAERPVPERVMKEVPDEPKKPSFSLEHFMGVKLFAWLGGIAMFFGVIFFVKYAFDRELISPAMRVALGFLTGAGLLVGGLWTHRKVAYRVLAQSLCATGVLVLYGVSFAAHAVYHFEAFSPPVTFGLMALITAAAFLIAVRFDALVVAVLGMIGGFLSPVLLPSVQDNVLPLFSYIAVLDLGILAVARHRNWSLLSIAAAAGTVLMQLIWFGKFFEAGRYFEGGATLVPIGILVFFSALFVLGAWWTKRMKSRDLWSSIAALGMVVVSMLFAFFFLTSTSIAERPFLLYGFVLVLNIAGMGVAVIQPKLGFAQLLTALLTFIHLALWTVGYLTPELFAASMVLYLVFGALHSVFPVIHQNLSAEALPPLTLRASPWFGPVILLMMFLTVFVLPELPLAVWAAVLVANLLILGLAFRSGGLAPVIGALVMTLLLAGCWLMRMPSQIESLQPFLLVIVGFGSLFTVAGVFFGNRFPAAVEKERGPMSLLSDPARSLPLLCGVLPFGLLGLAVLELPIANPSPVFGVALLLGILLLGLGVIGRQALLVPVALICTLAVEGVWHGTRFNPDEPWIALGWYLGFYAIYLLFPFVFRRRVGGQVAVWSASALSGVGHFLLVHDVVRRSFSEEMGSIMGVVPVAFAIPTIMALLFLIRTARTMDKTSQSQLAWFGGVALLFITLVFPIQLDRQWLTVSWALEGAALIWLFRRVPHVGLKWTGVALLVVSFARLAVNPAVFTDYLRSGTAIFNWHLYTFGLVAAALGAGGWLLPEAHRRFERVNLRAVFYGMSGVLCFMLLNIEIADYFTEPGERFVAFTFGGNFARDMTYSIAWGLFSLGLLGLGIWKRVAALRYTAIALLGLTLLKLFFHDLSVIDSIYRIGALIGVAIIAFIASFLYQQFFNRSEKS